MSKDLGFSCFWWLTWLHHLLFISPRVPMSDTRHSDIDDPLHHFGPQTYKIFKVSPSLTLEPFLCGHKMPNNLKFSCFVVTYVILNYLFLLDYLCGILTFRHKWLYTWNWATNIQNLQNICYSYSWTRSYLDTSFWVRITEVVTMLTSF